MPPSAQMVVVMDSACVVGGAMAHPHASQNSWYEASSSSSPSTGNGLGQGSADATAAAAVADELAGAYFKGQNYFSHMQGAYHGMSNGVFVCMIYRLLIYMLSLILITLLYLAAQPQMMSRGFYSPLHSMWGTAFGAGGGSMASHKQYPSAFPYSATHHGQAASSSSTLGKEDSSNGLSDEYPAVSSSSSPAVSTEAAAAAACGMTEQLMGLSAAGSYGMHHHPPAAVGGGGGTLSGGGGGGGRKMPEGTTCTSAASTTSAAYPYYSTSELAATMYGAGGSFVSRHPFQASSAGQRPKSKARTNAGKMSGDSLLLTNNNAVEDEEGAAHTHQIWYKNREKVEVPDNTRWPNRHRR